MTRITSASFWFTAAFAIATLLVLGSCHRAPEVRELPKRDVFIAMERDLQAFRSWGSVEIADANQQGTTHISGRDRLFVNALPLAGAKQFPVGTIIVKEIEPLAKTKSQAELGQAPAPAPGSSSNAAAGSTTAAAQKPQLFAMVKRGAGFNQQGALGWEWFELRERDDQSVAILWRGVGAPKGEEYGGDPLGTCNSCHGMAKANDFVKADMLKLSALASK